VLGARQIASVRDEREAVARNPQLLRVVVDLERDEGDEAIRAHEQRTQERKLERT